MIKKKHIVLIILAVSIALIVCYVDYRLRNRSLEHHRQIYLKYAGTFASGKLKPEELEAFMKARNSLINLRFFKHRKIDLEHIKLQSEPGVYLLKALSDNTNVKKGSYIVHPEKGKAPAAIEIWARKELYTTFIKQISCYDIEVKNILAPDSKKVELEKTVKPDILAPDSKKVELEKTVKSDILAPDSKKVELEKKQVKRTINKTKP